ncbi:hypothetical protein U1Q18_051873 [Sarracenia purpurea var. burkii]
MLPICNTSFAASQLGNKLAAQGYQTEDKPKFISASDYDDHNSGATLKHKSKPGLPPNTKQNFPYHADNLSIPYSGFPMTTFPFSPSLAPSRRLHSVPIFPTTAANLTAALLPPSWQR